MFGLFKKRELPMWLIVGLGNPGDKYTGNRHNIGFMSVDAIADANGIGPFKSKFQGEIAEGRIGNEKVAILKPQTFMNESGQSVSKAAKFFKIPPERVIVFYDELDLPPGKLRVRKGGGAAGHNGIRSMVSHMSTPEFWRVRMGIGHPGDKNRVSGYVLSDFTKSEQGWLADILRSAADNAPLLLNGKDSEFMTRIADDLK